MTAVDRKFHFRHEGCLPPGDSLPRASATKPLAHTLLLRKRSRLVTKWAADAPTDQTRPSRGVPSAPQSGHVRVERARLSARMTGFEIAQPAAVLHLGPVDHPADDHLLEEPHQRRPLLVVEGAEEL